MDFSTSQQVRAKVYFLEQSKLYETEKPYSLEFEGANLPSSNLISHKIEDLLIHDLRGKEHNFTFQENGFAILDIPSKMEYDDFDNMSKINDIYCPELAAAVMKYMGAKALQFFDAQIRRRHPDFPYQTMIEEAENQPAVQAHVDATDREVINIINSINEPENAARLLSGRYLYLNFWKPLKGPVVDWPLALCDAATVELTDFCPHDFVFSPIRARENLMVHYNSNHKWYYLSNQAPHEVFIFRQADSEQRPPVPHASFHSPLVSRADNSSPRESIEVRAIVYFDG